MYSLDSTCSNSSCSLCCSDESIDSDETCSSLECQGHDDDLDETTQKYINKPTLPIEKKVPPIPNIASSSYIPPLPFTNKHSLCPIPPLPEINSNKIFKPISKGNTGNLRPSNNVASTNFGNNYDSEAKFSNDVNSLVSTRFSASNLDIPNVSKPPIALPRSMPKHHIVDIIPKPILNKAQSITTLYSSTSDQSQNTLKHMVHNTYLSPSYTKMTKAQETVNRSAPIYQYPLISGQIPRQSVLLNYASKFSNNVQCNTNKIPPPPSITNAKTLLNTSLEQNISKLPATHNPTNGNGSKQVGEKNKVKFSDTVTVAVVPVSVICFLCIDTLMLTSNVVLGNSKKR